MIIETERLTIHMASEEEMGHFIDLQSDKILIAAYKEMLQGCLDHPNHREWYAL